MKNPFEKDNHRTLILAAAIASLAVAGAFLFFTDKGKGNRKGLKNKIKSIAKDAAVNAISKRSKIKKKAVKALADRAVKTD